MLEVLTMVPEEVVEKYDREMDRRTRQNLERFAEFMARMIEKYGHKVLAEWCGIKKVDSLFSRIS